MKELLKSKVGQFRIIGFLEGTSLLILVFITVPMKYIFGNPIGSEVIGPIHGFLFLLYVYYTLIISSEQNWKFKNITWKVLLASFIPFGTFYIDKKILSKVPVTEKK
jgi:integral membrane protein